MTDSVANQESDFVDGKQQPSNVNTKAAKVPISAGVPYPIETIEAILQMAKQMASEHGTGRPITKEEIAKAANKSINGLSQYYSTFVQYGIFNTVHGKGYSSTELLRKYMNPVHDDDENKCMMEMFKKPSLYSKIIENQNGQIIPTDPKRFGNMLKEEPYNITDYAAEKAAKIFLENARHLGLLDSKNTFRVNGLTPPVNDNYAPEGQKEQKSSPNHKLAESELFELPIPLSGNRKAKLYYPLDNLTRKDIRVIAKALAYIASTVLEEDEAIAAEKEINKEVLGKE